MAHHPPDERVFALLLAHPVVRRLAEAAREAGGGASCHLVGGILRDRLLGIPSRDFDAVVDRRGEEIGRFLSARLPARLVRLGGKEFPSHRLVGKGFVLDLWERTSISLEDDLARRDFTVNAFALDLATGAVLDPFGGRRDLVARILRATTRSSFTGDPLRVLRLPRLLLQLPGFSAAAGTIELARAAAPRLATVAAERVREELLLIAGHDETHRGVALLEALDVYPGFWLGRPGEPARPGPVVAQLAAVGETLRLLRRLADAPPPPDLPAVRLALLFANLPPVLAGGGPEAAVRALERFTAAGYLPQRLAAAVTRLLTAPPLPATSAPAGERRLFLHFQGDGREGGARGGGWTSTALLQGAQALAAGPEHSEIWLRRARAAAELAEAAGDEIFDPPPLLDGRALQEHLGLSPGPALGRLLGQLRRGQVEGRLRDREQALAEARRLARSAAG